LVLVFALPFCLLLPDGDYAVKLADDDIVNLNLSKVIPIIYDERLPFRGFKKGELDNISYLWVMILGNGGKRIDVADLSKIKEHGIVTKYIDKRGKEIVPQLITDDVDVAESEIMNESFKEKFKDTVPSEFLEQHTADEYYQGRQIIINGELARDRFGRFRYTKVKYNSTKQLHYGDEFKRAIRAVNILIDVYREQTFDYWITNVTEKEIFIYKIINEHQFQMGYSIKGFSQTRPDHGLETVNKIKSEIIDPQPELPYFMLILDAEQSLDNEKYFLSVIYAITALESFVKMYVIFHCKKAGISKKVEKNLTSTSLFFLVTTILRMFVNPGDLSDELVSKIEVGIKLRNKIIHRTKLDVSEQEAGNVIKSVKEIARVLAFDLGKFDEGAK
jgi:uncharacterized protein (UPF0332 family)